LILCKSHAIKCYHVVIHAKELLERNSVFHVLNKSALIRCQQREDSNKILMTSAQSVIVLALDKSQVFFLTVDTYSIWHALKARSKEGGMDLVLSSTI